jgi:hypothetical protein
MNVPGVETTAERLAGWAAIGGGALVAIGSLMPWLSITAPFVGTISKNGTDGDGKITLVVGCSPSVSDCCC